jgi:hypothetical protein
VTRIEAEFVVQDGECGRQTLGIKVDICGQLQTDWTDNWLGWHCERMASQMIQDVHDRIEDGKLWEGAYLVTHHNDSTDE